MKLGFKSSSSAVFGMGLGIVFLIALGTFQHPQDRPLAASNMQSSAWQCGQRSEDLVGAGGFL